MRECFTRENFSSSAYSGNTINFDRRLISFVLHAQDSEGTQSNSWIKTHISLTEVEIEIFFFFCMLRMEGELNYTREIYILLLLQSQSGRGVSLENLCPAWYELLHLQKKKKYSSSSAILEWKGSFIRKSLPTLILASAFTEKEKIFFFFYILRVEGEFH